MINMSIKDVLEPIQDSNHQVLSTKITLEAQKTEIKNFKTGKKGPKYFKFNN